MDVLSLSWLDDESQCIINNNMLTGSMDGYVSVDIPRSGACFDVGDNRMVPTACRSVRHQNGSLALNTDGCGCRLCQR